MLAPASNLVIVSIGIQGEKLNNLSKQASDTSLAGIWKLTENGQDYYWALKADGNSLFMYSSSFDSSSRGSAMPYTVSGSTLTLDGMKLTKK